MTAVLVLAFSAGMVATVNPCGFAMLPAYLSYFMGVDTESTSTSGALRSALEVGGIVSFGFLAVFGIAGVVISTIAAGATRWIPWLALAVGIGIVVLGLAMVAGYQPKVGLPTATRTRLEGGRRGVLGFGVSYAIASLSCTLPVFLTVVATQFTRRSLAEGVLIFVVYAAGMATVLIGLTVILALGKQRLVGVLRRTGLFINRVSGVVLVLAGGWIIWFWSTALASGASSLGGNSTFGFIENLSQSALNFVRDNTWSVAVGFAAVIAVGIWGAMRGQEPPVPTPSGADRSDDREAEGTLRGGSAH